MIPLPATTLGLHQIAEAHKFGDLVDLARLRRMAANLYAAGGIPIGILDPDGTVLVGAGWQDICVKFHRVNPITCQRCRESESFIKANLDAKSPVGYKCLNGMWDIAVPIVVADVHMATLFVGQFFYDDEMPDVEFFRKQAAEFGFDEADYLDALKHTAVFSRKRVESMMCYYQDLVQTLAENGLARIQLMQARDSLEVEVEERTIDLQRARDELARRAESLERAGQAKSEFLSTMSHELRTPLNAVLSLSHVLGLQADGRLTPEELSYLGTIERNGRSMLTLINDMLDLAKIEAGKAELTIKEISVSGAVANSIEVVEPLSSDKGLTITTHVDPATPTVFTDPRRLHQILQNLLGNAVKFTQKGGVRVDIRPSESGGVMIEVSDTGIGIPPESLPHIFEEFHQVPSLHGATQTGTGLGLAIVEKSLHLLGGTISVRSEPGQGSVFSILLPLRPPEEPQTLSASPTSP